MGLAGNKSSRRAGLEDAELHSMLANAQEQSTGGTWRRAVAGAGTLIVGCACVAATLDGGAAAPGVLALSGDKVGKGAVSTAAKHPKSDWGIGDEVVSDFHKVLQGHFTSEKSKTTAPSEATYLLRMGLVQKSTRPGEPTPGGSMITGLKDQSGAGTLLPAKYKAEAAARLQTLAEQGAAQSTAAKATPARTEALMNKYRLSEGIPQNGLPEDAVAQSRQAVSDSLKRLLLQARQAETAYGHVQYAMARLQGAVGTLSQIAGQVHAQQQY
jgi:hypothetical protein